MMLTVPEAAKALDLDPEILFQWIDRREVPVHRVRDRLRLDDGELLEWATARGLPVAPGGATPGLAAALAEGGVHRRLAAADKEAALREAVRVMRLPAGFDRDYLFQMLVARERLGSTALGGGLAIPHPRHPIVLPTDRPAVAVCSFPGGVDFEAPDGLPVDTVVTIVSPNTRAHLALLSSLASALQDPAFREAMRYAPPDQLLARARRLEAGRKPTP